MTPTRTLAALLACCLAVPMLRAENILFLGSRPTWLRLEVTIDGQTPAQSLQAHLKARFEYLDQDGDGRLSVDELKRMITRQELRQQMSLTTNSFVQRRGGTVALSEVDSDGDGQVSLNEFIDYYLASAPDQFTLQPAPVSDPYGQLLSDELLAKLDRDGNGKLAKAELAQAPKLIEQFDTNDDECVAALELVPDLLQRRVGAMPGMPAMPAMPAMGKEKGPGGLTGLNQPIRTGPPFVRFASKGKVDSVAEQLIDIYDRNQDRTLSRPEIGLDEKAFARLDRDMDGQLDSTELIDWLEQDQPDVTVRCQLGLSKPGEQVDFTIADWLTGYAKASNHARPTLWLGRTRLIVESLLPQLNRGVDAGYEQATVQSVQSLFQFYDRQQKGFIDLNDPQLVRNLGLRATFTDADANGDGKLTRDELLAHQRLMQSAQRQMLLLAYTRQSPSAFALLDVNRDGRLSRGELSNAWNRLAEWLPVEGDELRLGERESEYRLAIGLLRQQYSGFSYNPLAPLQSRLVPHAGARAKLVRGDGPQRRRGRVAARVPGHARRLRPHRHQPRWRHLAGRGRGVRAGADFNQSAPLSRFGAISAAE
jgi:Ca2+-binding EF-hand superfamily protein